MYHFPWICSYLINRILRKYPGTPQHGTVFSQEESFSPYLEEIGA